MAVGVTDVSGVHCMAEAMGAVYGLPHGNCCAVCIPPIMEYNLEVSLDKYVRLALAFGAARSAGDDSTLARLAIARVRELIRLLNIPAMGDVIKPEDLDVLALKAEQNTSNPSNPRAADAANYRSLFAASIG
jgi:alcohol dehydrogenase